LKSIRKQGNPKIFKGSRFRYMMGVKGHGEDGK
jgi:hypothetical protein